MQSLKIHFLRRRHRHVPPAPDYSQIGKQMQRALPLLSEVFHMQSLKIHFLRRRHRHVPPAPDYSQIGKQMQRALPLLR